MNNVVLSALEYCHQMLALFFTGVLLPPDARSLHGSAWLLTGRGRPLRAKWLRMSMEQSTDVKKNKKTPQLLLSTETSGETPLQWQSPVHLKQGGYHGRSAAVQRLPTCSISKGQFSRPAARRLKGIPLTLA